MTEQEFVDKWSVLQGLQKFPPQSRQFMEDLRAVSGAWLNACAEAARIEDYDPKLCIERLRGNRPPEWKLMYDDLMHRIERIESILNL